MSNSEKLPPVLSIATLVAPISEERPCGTSREHGEDFDLGVAYGQIRDDFDMAKRIERARAELEMLSGEQRQMVLQTSKDRPDSPSETPRWDRIISQSELILTRHSKDMRVVNWLVEAACRVHGLVGLRDSLDLCLELIKTYAERLFPVSADDPLCCYRPIRNLSTSPSLMTAIKQVSFVKGQTCHFVGYEFAKYINTLSVADQEGMRAQGKLTQDDFSAFILECSVEQINNYYQQIDEAMASAKQLDEALSKFSNKESFSISKIIEQLEQIRAWFQALCKERPAEEEGVSELEEAAAAEQGSGASAGGAAKAANIDPVAVALRSREDALNQLNRVAKFFRATEPHSPLSYALEQAVRWGKMGLPALLKEVVQDDTTRRDLFRLMGIQEEENNS